MPNPILAATFRPPALLCAGLLILGLLYLPGTHGPFQLDDFSNLIGNDALLLSELNIQTLSDAAYSRPSGPTWRPVSMSSFALNAYLSGGLDSAAVKLTNVVLHLVSVILVFFLLRRVIKLARGKDTGWIALIGALAWGLHPLHVSSVLYAVQRMTLLSAIFSLGSVLLYLRIRRDLTSLTRINTVQLLSVLGVGAGILFAVFSKENGALAIPLLLVLELTLFNSHNSRLDEVSRTLLRGLLLLPSLLIAGYLLHQLAVNPLLPLREFDTHERFLTEGRVMVFYLTQLLWPDITRMSLFHSGFPISTNWLNPLSTLFAWVALCCCGALAAVAIKQRKMIIGAIGVLWFLIGHLLESTSLGLELVFEHRNYLPSIGIAMVLCEMLLQLDSRLSVRRSLKFAGSMSLLLLFAGQLQLRAESWSSSAKFLSFELTHHAENPRAWVSLAHQLYLESRFEEAARFYRHAATLEPQEAGNLLGAFFIDLIVLRREITPEELHGLLDLIASKPLSAFAAAQLYILANRTLEAVRQERHRLPVAEQILLTANRNRQWPSSRHRGTHAMLLGAILLSAGETTSGVELMETGLGLHPDAYGVALDLARYYLATGNRSRAQATLERINWRSQSPAVRSQWEALAKIIKKAP